MPPIPAVSEVVEIHRNIERPDSLPESPLYRRSRGWRRDRKSPSSRNFLAPVRQSPESHGQLHSKSPTRCRHRGDADNYGIIAVVARHPAGLRTVRARLDLCMRCGHSKLTSPRWLVAQVKEAPDRFDALAKRLWCEPCAEKGGRRANRRTAQQQSVIVQVAIILIYKFLYVRARRSCR